MKKLSPTLPRRWIGLAVLLITLFATPVGYGLAQETMVIISPSSSAVVVGATTTVDIRIENVSDLYGAEVHLTFNPGLLEVLDADASRAGVQIQPGTFLSPDFEVNSVDHTTGEIDFAISQMPPHEPVSGSGVLATVTFKGKATGTSAINFVNVILSAPGGVFISAVTQGGSLTVTPDGAITPTPTATPTATPTPPPGTSLRFDPQLAYVGVGETRGVKLHVANASNLYGVEVHLTHGSGIDAVAITAGPCVADVVAIRSVDGNKVDYVASLQAPSPSVYGECDLATITFQGLDDGTYAVQFVSALLSDPDGNALPVTTYDGTVVVDGGICDDILGYHTVRPRETLYCIGRAYGVDPYAIARCNSIVNPNRIYVGHRLAIPNVPRWLPYGPVCPRQFDGGTPSPPCRWHHPVAPGETLYSISVRYGVSMWAIAEANHIFNLHYIRAGQVLCIP